MKRLLFLMSFMLFYSFALSQENTYQITYENFYELSEDGLAYEFEDKETRDFYKELWTRKKVFHLLTDKRKGHFSQEHHLEDQKILNSSDGAVVSYDSHVADLYLNYKEQTWSQPTDIKNLIVKDDLAKLKWNIDRNASNVPQFFGFKTMKADINDGSGMIITAYYTLEIPISAGPEKYYGLPGLILYLEMRLEEDDPESAIVANIWQAKLVEEVKQSIPSFKIKKRTKLISEMDYHNLLETNMQKQQEYNSSGVEKID